MKSWWLQTIELGDSLGGRGIVQPRISYSRPIGTEPHTTDAGKAPIVFSRVQSSEFSVCNAPVAMYGYMPKGGRNSVMLCILHDCVIDAPFVCCSMTGKLERWLVEAIRRFAQDDFTVPELQERHEKHVNQCLRSHVTTRRRNN